MKLSVLMNIDITEIIFINTDLVEKLYKQYQIELINLTKFKSL